MIQNQVQMLEDGPNKIQILLRRVGGQNKYQYCIFLAFALKWIIAAMILFSLNFFYIVPDFTCTKAEMADYQTCQKFVCSYDDQNFWYQHLQKPIPRSIALDYGVIMACSKQWISSLLQSLSYVGSLFGYIIMSHIGDNYGRKKGELIAWIVCIIGQIIMVFSVNLVMIGAGSLLLGFGANAAITLHYSFFKELVLGKTRQRMIIAIQIAFSLGISLISLLSYLIYQWKYIMGFFILIPSILSMFAFRFVQETPEFTLKKGQQTFRKSFNRIAAFNGMDQLQSQQVQRVLANCSISSQNTEVALLDLFRYKSLRYISLIAAAINFGIQFVFDGTLLSLSKFGFNVYFDQMLVGLVEIGAAFFAVYMIPKVRRRVFVMVGCVIIAVVSVGMGIQALTYHHQTNQINFHTSIQMVLIAILRFVINSLWGVFFVFVSQLFPTEVSSISYGWVSIVGTIGASVSPYIRLATADLAMFVMSIINVGMVFMVWTLEQTKGKTLRTRIMQRQEQENAYQKEKHRQSVVSDS